MGRIVILLAMIMFSLNAFCQSNVKYTYDNFGNRIKREVKTIELLSAKIDDTTKIAPEVITESWDEQTLRIYPNPTKGNIQVEILGGEDDEDYELKVYAPNGAELISTKSKSNQKKSIDLSKYPPGNYFLLIRSSGQSATFKIVKR